MLPEIAFKAGGWSMFTISVEVQLFASVTVTLYAPKGRKTALAALPPVGSQAKL